MLVQMVTLRIALPMTLRNKHFELPFDVSPCFTGRDDIGRELRDNCLPSKNLAPKLQKRFVLYGLGGSGKTQMALKFASDHRERYGNSICSVYSILHRYFANSCQAFGAFSLSIPAVSTWPNKHSREWPEYAK